MVTARTRHSTAPSATGSARCGTWQRTGGCDDWARGPRGALALIVLLDQFPRNMFRDSPRAFATDDRALRASSLALARGWDLKIDGPIRQFCYMPFMHSERLTDQDRSVRLMKARMVDTDNLLHARAHREIIRRFGRFPPYRNARARPRVHPGGGGVSDRRRAMAPSCRT